MHSPTTGTELISMVGYAPGIAILIWQIVRYVLLKKPYTGVAAVFTGFAFASLLCTRLFPAWANGTGVGLASKAMFYGPFVLHIAFGLLRVHSLRQEFTPGVVASLVAGLMVLGVQAYTFAIFVIAS